ncbi:hypothetical protein [Nonomuraea jiangxiensis]|uniref:Uncharacterized protein n=1 Tax=Nonomuraea jiangxiensis TaxID=633440 RepID=A0A1G8M606_9ACTN|nr:hypothetical protein [Nonomuraea jiangxiensis]SDI63382.1 hypothetical protein SAMN05421869_106315 [Nonomuraea jiangxiensis]
MDIEVLAGGDRLRQERLTRSLHHALLDVDGISVDYPDSEEISTDARKSGAATHVILAVTLLGAARPALQLLLTAIKEWSAIERNRKVRLTEGERSIEITVRPDEA